MALWTPPAPSRATTTTRVSRQSAGEQCGRVVEGFSYRCSQVFAGTTAICPTVGATVTRFPRTKPFPLCPARRPSLPSVTRCSTSAAAVPLYWSNLTCEVSPSVCSSGGRQWLSRLRSSVSAVNNRDTSAWLLRPLARGLVTIMSSKRNWASKYKEKTFKKIRSNECESKMKKERQWEFGLTLPRVTFASFFHFVYTYFVSLCLFALSFFLLCTFILNSSWFLLHTNLYRNMYKHFVYRILWCISCHWSVAAFVVRYLDGHASDDQFRARFY